MTLSDSGLQIFDLHFSYPERVLFRSWSAQLPPGLTWIKGDEGTGKSTLLRVLAGRLAPQGGKLELNGARFKAGAEAFNAQVFLTEPPSNISDQITPLEYFAKLRPQYPAFNQALLESLQQALDLRPHLDKKLFMLSNGSRRKVWLAAAFASGATLTLIDDPFSALDRPSIKVLRELMEDATEQITRTFVVADYEVPEGLAITKLIELSPPPA
jgi:ABC-type multidrug transport system ATPase subunit